MQTWGAAAVTTAALYALPLTLAGALTGVRVWIAALAADLLVLVAAAVRLWSPLAVLGMAVLSCAGAGALFFVAALDSCGDSRLAAAVEWSGAALVALALGTWGVRRGAHAFWTPFAGWIAGAAWIALWAHLIPGGSGGCWS